MAARLGSAVRFGLDSAEAREPAKAQGIEFKGRWRVAAGLMVKFKAATARQSRTSRSAGQ